MLEIVVSSIEDAENAIRGGADSLEVIQDLSVGGLTPQFAVVEAICTIAGDVEVHVIIRPHAQNFIYGDSDLAQIEDFILSTKALNIKTFVLGALTPENTINYAILSRVAEYAHPIPLTFHRAIDGCIEQADALNNLPNSVVRILSSGLNENAWEGRNQIKRWVTEWQPRFQFVCAGGVSLENLAELASLTRADVFHIGSAVRIDNRVDAELVKMAKDILSTAAE